MSSLGKGLAASSLSVCLQARGYKVRMRKLDPYLNVDPGTMSPGQHGEVFVTDDGAETDLDLGHYERFTGCQATRNDSTTAGQIYLDILQRERQGDYLGSTVQVVPHVTDSIKDFILRDNESFDFVLVEIGGTVGDIEGLPFFEAIRQLSGELPYQHVVCIHLTLVPWLAHAGELKTKPTQHSVKELRSIMIQPDILVARVDKEIMPVERKKLSLFCNVRPSAVIQAMNVASIYDAPLYYHREGLDEEVLAAFGISNRPKPDLSRWELILQRVHHPASEVTVAVVGKYVGLSDAYKSLVESLVHGGIANNVKVNIKWIDAESLTETCLEEILSSVSGIVVPGGFGKRGICGKIMTAGYARRKKIPYFGICLGMQVAVIEVARNLLDMKHAGSTEFEPDCSDPVICLLEEWYQGPVLKQRDASGALGGTMRLGAYQAVLRPESGISRIYGKTEISERHRHRYEVNLMYRDQLQGVGVHFTGMSPDGLLPEVLELEGHPWFIGVQYHPEMKSRPFDPHPLFASFVAAAMEHQDRENDSNSTPHE